MAHFYETLPHLRIRIMASAAHKSLRGNSRGRLHVGPPLLAASRHSCRLFSSIAPQGGKSGGPTWTCLPRVFTHIHNDGDHRGPAMEHLALKGIYVPHPHGRGLRTSRLAEALR